MRGRIGLTVDGENLFRRTSRRQTKGWKPFAAATEMIFTGFRRTVL